MRISKRMLGGVMKNTETPENVLKKVHGINVKKMSYVEIWNEGARHRHIAELLEDIWYKEMRAKKTK